MNGIDTATLNASLRREVRFKVVELLDDLLEEQQIDTLCRAAGHRCRRRLFTPYVTICGLLIQALDDKKSQAKAVIDLMHQLEALHMRVGSHDPSSFCAARQRLPQEVLPTLVQRVGDRLEEQVPASWRTFGRPVKLVDGTTVSMPDSLENREYFGCPSNQHDSCSMPLARVTALFSLQTGAVLSARISPYRTSENQQWMSLMQDLEAGDIVVGDRLFGSYAAIAMLRERKVDGIFRVNQRRKVPRGNWTECIVTWKKELMPAGMQADDYQRLAPQMKVRLIRANQIDPKSKHRKEVIIVTTLLDKRRYPAKKIVELYGRRWDVELNLRHIKSTMNMAILSGQKPQTVRLEFHAHLLAYNLLRNVMWKAGLSRGINPIRLSLEAARQEVLAWYRFHITRPAKGHSALLDAVASHRIPHRPGRTEPRLLRRARRKYQLMNKPRHLLREQMSMTP